ncbi:DUF4214 domain-containing protein [Massilia sp. Root418]|jgi:hypothetical protein|uniref:DUF4214 domain-containing protein n=1 Tax=Massilia sp. Root418 TaxID=1736532 RepID=UPI000ABDC906|nr:DUF4214 domain-containing protein [Massilia sp. Root418]
MATTVTEIQALYVAYFNRPADVLGLQFWLDRANASPNGADSVANEFSNSDEYRDLYANKTSAEIVDAIYMNLFGRHAEAAGLVYWANKLNTGELNIGNVARIISQSAQNEDQVAIDSKVSAAEQFTASLTDASEILGYSGDAANAVAKTWLSGVKDEATLAAATTEAALQAVSDAAVDAHDGEVNVPTTSVLTKGLDNVNGGAGSDLIIGAIDSGNSELNTLSGIDNINGGAGIDTLKIAHNTGTITLGNLSNVEIVTIESATAVTLDASTVVGVTNLNIAKAGGNIDATAAASTSVNVSLKDGGTVKVSGGKDVNVALTDNTHNIDVGATGTDPVGAVTITTTGAAAINNTNVTMGNISVGGGKTVNVTQHATSNAGAIVADAVTETVTQGNVVVTASALTTDVTVTQDATVAAASRVAVTGATEVASVKFTKLNSGESVTVGSLTFTAAKDLTAAEVAQAFANVGTSAVLPTQIAGSPTTATGDTNGSSAAANGIFTGALLANWSTAASADDTVVFNGKANTALTDLIATAKATVTTTTQGVAAVTAKNTLGVTAGTVTIDGGVALKTVTVDGFAASTGVAGVNGSTNTALDTIKLSNGASFTVDSAAATLALALNNVDGTVTVAAGAKTINAQVDGADVDTVLASGSAETINVTGAGNVVGDTTSGLTAAKAISTVGLTGTATFTIANGTATTFTGGAGVDTVTVSNAGTAITKAIDLGAGDDSLTLNGTVVVPTAALNGGDGTDTIGLNGASAATLSANGDFAGKISGFEKLAITDTVGTATTVNMANMDGITYVVSNNSTAVGTSATKEVFTVDFATSGTITGADRIVFDGVTVTLAGGESAAQIAAKFVGQTYGNWVATGLNGSVVTFEAINPGAVTPNVTAASFVVTDVDATTAAVVAAAPSAQGTVSYTLDLTGVALYDTDTLTIGGQTVYTAPAATTLQNATAVKAGAVATGTVTIGGVVYTISAGTGNNIILTTSNVAPAATLTFAAVDTGADGNGFAAGTPAVVAKVNAASEAFSANFATSGAIEDGDTIVFDGVTITLATGNTPTQIAAAVAAGTYANWTAVQSGTSVDFVAKTAGVKADVVSNDFAITNVNVLNNATAPKAVVVTTSEGAGAGAGNAALTIDKLANAGTVELVAAGAGVIVKMADASGSADSFNLVTKVDASDLSFGTVTVAGVETIKFSAIDLDTTTVNTASVTLKADKATALTIDGSSNVTLTLDATTTKLATIDASALTGKLAASANGSVAMTITGGAGADTLHASVGTSAKADVINGGAGKDVIYAGTNGAHLTGGDGNDLFIVTAASASEGNKESNTYSEILDFKAGDLLQLQAYNNGTAAAADVSSLGKLTATLNESTAVFSDFVNAAIKQADAGAAVWFNYKGDAYVVVDSDLNSTSDTFANGTDLIVKLTGINGDNLSFNSDFGTAALV